MSIFSKKEIGEVSPEVLRRFEERFLDLPAFVDWFSVLEQFFGEDLELDPAEMRPDFWHLLVNELEDRNQEDVAGDIGLLITRVYADGPFVLLERVAYKDLRIPAPAIKFWYPAVFSPFLWKSGENGIEGVYTNFDAGEAYCAPRRLRPFPGLASAEFIRQWNNALMAAWGRGR
tara:strand:- start:173 stop:694 length:522 start_codon:yes stop_codon:yes gene_type:complete